MTKTHIIYIPFTGVGTNRVFSNEWLKDRIEIFKNYTLKSLLNQTNKDFHIWLSFRPEDKENPLLRELDGYDFIKTFHGLAYWDDRNEEANKTLEERLGASLDYLPGGRSNYIYLTRIDSDDMLHKDVVQLIQDQEVYGVKALTLQNGYVYNKDTNEVAEWNPLTNPPFHTVIFPKDVFFDPQEHIEWYEGFKSHEDIARLPHKVLWRGDNRRDRLYMVFTHNPKMHLSTTWNHEFKGKNVNIDLSEFGI
jgi:hypothetical protein